MKLLVYFSLLAISDLAAPFPAPLPGSTPAPAPEARNVWRPKHVLDELWLKPAILQHGPKIHKDKQPSNAHESHNEQDGDRGSKRCLSPWFWEWKGLGMIPQVHKDKLGEGHPLPPSGPAKGTRMRHLPYFADTVNGIIRGEGREHFNPKEKRGIIPGSGLFGKVWKYVKGIPKGAKRFGSKVGSKVGGKFRSGGAKARGGAKDNKGRPSRGGHHSSPGQRPEAPLGAFSATRPRPPQTANAANRPGPPPMNKQGVNKHKASHLHDEGIESTDWYYKNPGSGGMP